jgi:spermidine synthase
MPSVTYLRSTLSIFVVACLSGFAGLGYEIIWTRLLSVSLGHEIVAVLGVLAALFAGLALGSLATGRRIANSVRPGVWYAGLELLIGAWAIILIPLFPLVGDLVPALMPVDVSPMWQWSVAFALPFVLLLPATFAMGGTLPALEAVLARRLQAGGAGGAVGKVYAANTLGAVAGTLVTTFLLIPTFGLSITLAVCAAVNLFCGCAVLWLKAGVMGGATASWPAGSFQMRDLQRLAPLFITGLLGIGYEVLTIRVVSQILENTIYTFAMLLAVYLLGTALGAALHGQIARRYASESLTTGLVLATSLCCAGGAAMLAVSETILGALYQLAPPTMSGRLGAELGIAAVAFLLPTIAMGALFTQLAQAARNRDGSLGAALAVNTFGAALAPIAFGPLLIPLVGAKVGFAIVVMLYLVVLPNLRRRTLALAAVPLAAASALVLSPPSLRFVQPLPGGTLIWHRDGVMAAVSVVSEESGARHLQVNSHFRMGGDASIRSDYREAHIPLLLHPDPKRALFLGLGTGTTLSAAGDHPGLVVDGVELVPEVVESFPLFARSAPNIGRNPDLRIHVADARRFVRAAGDRYDVVMADLFHPSLDGSGALYTREHFAAIRARLTDDGLFCQWLPLYQLDIATLRIIVRTFLEAFPDSTAYLAQFSVETPLIALVGARAPKIYPADWLRGRVKNDAIGAKLAALNLKDDTALFGLYLAGAAALHSFAGPGPLNSDDRPLVTTAAPRTAYAPIDTPGARLVELLDIFHPRPEEVLLAADGDAARRLADYWRARDRFLRLGVRTQMVGDARNFIANIAPQLIEIVQISADFDAAYLPVLAMARQLGRSDPSAARKLLEALDNANPTRPEARRMLASLPPN